MAISDVIPKGSIWTGIAVGAGLLLAPVVIPAVASAARPLLKAIIRGGYMLYEEAQEMVTEVTDHAEVLIEETKSELHPLLQEAKGAKESSVKVRLTKK